MTITALALFAADAWACDRVEVEVDVDGSEVVVHNCWVRDTAEPVPPPVIRPSVDEAPRPEKKGAGHDDVILQYGMQFLPDMPGHNLAGKLVGDDDSYFNVELRYMPGSDVRWVSRAGAGFDVLGDSDWDLTLGVFLGAAGIWDRERNSAVMYAAPVGGGELGIGYEGERLFGKYRFIAAVDTGRVPGALTENELTVGYKIFESIHAYGQYLFLTPRAPESQRGVGMGLRVQL
ncbi:MAG: hypothetical protein R3F59_21460 [Myxococcota bacterium]